MKNKAIGIVIIENLPKANDRYFSTLCSDDGSQNTIIYFAKDNYTKLCVNINSEQKTIFYGQMIYMAN